MSYHVGTEDRKRFSTKYYAANSGKLAMVEHSTINDYEYYNLLSGSFN